MRIYSLLHPLFLSFYSRDFYIDVGQYWRGIAFVYLMLLCFLITLSLSFAMQSVITEISTDVAPGYIKQIPTIEITNGAAYVDQPQPYYIVDVDTGKSLAVIDTTGQLASLEGMDYVLLLTETQLITRKSDNEIRIYELKDIDDIVINQYLLNYLNEKIDAWLAIVLSPFIFIFFYLVKAIQAFIYGLFGLIFTRLMHVDLDYPALISLAIMAMTPLSVIDILLTPFDEGLPFGWIISFLITLVYLAFAVHSNKGMNNPEEHAVL